MVLSKEHLLDVRTNRPWVINGEKIYRDLVIIHFDLEGGRGAQIIINKIKTGYVDSYAAANYLKEITKVRKEKGCRNIHKTIVWANDLHIAEGFFKDYEFKKEYSESSKGQKLWRIYDDEFEIRNFNIITNTPSLEALRKSCGFEEKLSSTAIMKKFLMLREKQGLKGWGKLNYSFAYCANKLFFKGLEELKYNNSKSIPNLDAYNLLQSCNKAGLLFYNKDYERVVLNDVYGWDLSSAYPSQFVNQKMPIGQFRIMPASKQSLATALENDWALLVKIKTTKKIEKDLLGSEFEEKEDGFYYTFNEWDIKCYKLLGISLKGKIVEIRVCKEKDYLDYEFRKRIVEYYEDKQKSKGVNDELYFEKKTTLDAIWGKGLQDFKPEKEEEVRERYFRNHNRYLLPQWSLWGAAATRYEMIKAIMEVIDNGIEDFVATDTDGIKFLDEVHNTYFEKRNKEIMEKNAAAGFPNCEIGTWKFEGHFDNFIQLKKKVYAYSVNGNLTCKFAGCTKDAWVKFFEDKGIEEAFNLMSSESFFIPPAYGASKTYGWKDGVLFVKSNGYKPGDENLETYQVKAV